MRDVGRAVEFAPMPVDGDWIVVATEGPVRRLRGTDGKDVWRRGLPGVVRGVPFRGEGLLVFGTEDRGGGVFALDAQTGEVRWKHEGMDALLAGGESALVLVDRGGRTECLDPVTGDVLWATTLQGAGRYAPALDTESDGVFVPVAPDSVVALEGRDGRRRWARQVGPGPLLARSGPPLVLATQDSLVLLLDSGDGRETARCPLPALAAGAPTVGEGSVFVAVRTGWILALDAATLVERWRRPLKPPLISSPLYANGEIWQSGPSGCIYGFDARSGAPLSVMFHTEFLLAPPGATATRLAVGGHEGTLMLFSREGAR